MVLHYHNHNGDVNCDWDARELLHEQLTSPVSLFTIIGFHPWFRLRHMGFLALSRFEKAFPSVYTIHMVVRGVFAGSGWNREKT